MTKAVDRKDQSDNRKPKAPRNGDKPKRYAKTDRPVTSKDKNGAQHVDKSKKIQKAVKTPTELQSHYQRIVINIKKRKLNKEMLNKAIGDFLQYFQKNSTSLTSKIMGAKAIQLCLKYGNSSHRETILLVLLKNDFVALCSSVYGGFIISKIFKYCDKLDSIKVVKDFFKKNFRDLLKKKENLIALNAYIACMDEKTALNYLEKELTNVKLEEFYFHELIEYIEKKPSIMKLSLVYYMIYHFFDSIIEEQRVTLLQIILKHVDEAINKSEQKYFVILCVLRIFLNVNFKNKKEVIKKFLKEKYLDYYTKHAGFIYLLMALLKKISDLKVVNITILKALKGQFEMVFSSVDMAKLIELLFSNEIADRLQKDRFFKCNAMVKKLLEVEAIDKDPVVKNNLSHIRAELVAEPELLEYLSFDQLKYKSNENSAFSLLYSAIIEQMLRSKLNRPAYGSPYQQPLGAMVLVRFKRSR